ncbi:MAG TPA: hemopexin repeat-containing protein [Pyrinomonadaceae bacterium]|nr:hemopexin repeat-containing protein [Pyrinomonadaceae bacterium]
MKGTKYLTKLTKAKLSVMIIAIALVPLQRISAAPDNCATLANEVKSLEAQRASLQKDLQKAAGSGEKQGLIAQIKQINAQIQPKQAELDKCLNSTEVLNQCSPPPDSYYKFPFGQEGGWVLARGNWNDPTNAHNQGDPNGMQAFSFDFLRMVNNVDEPGQHILAARPGTVYDLEESQTGNSWGATKIFFFKGDQVLRYDLSTGKVDPGFPKQISAIFNGWPQSWNDVDAAINWGNGKIYFFKGSQYLRYDFAANHVDAGFPRSIAGNWPGWPSSWNSGIDDAMNWGNGKVFFFKGGEYLRYDIDADHVDANYPQSIAGGNWKNFPNGWNANFDAAIPWSFGRAVFFKGNQALTVEMKTHKAMGGAYSVGSGISNWPASWSKIDAALVWSHDGYLGVGNYIVIDHGDGTFATYWHLGRHGVRVKVGDKVERGDWIAVSGNTGNSSQPHFHFDVRSGWDKAYPANVHEYPNVKLRFQDYSHKCWIPKVGEALSSNN